MRPAFNGIDIIDKGKNILGITGVILKSNFDYDVIFLSFKVNRSGIKDSLILI